MAYNQGGLNDIKDLAGIKQSMMSPMQGAAPSYSFGDVTRVGKMEQGAQVPKNQRFNPDETFPDTSRVGIYPFKKKKKGFSFTAIG